MGPLTIELSLSLLLAAEMPNDVETCEVSMREITRRLGALIPGSLMHEAAHARLDDLLTRRERLTPGGG